jgi:hypothetical protein
VNQSVLAVSYCAPMCECSERAFDAAGRPSHCIHTLEHSKTQFCVIELALLSEHQYIPAALITAAARLQRISVARKRLIIYSIRVKVCCRGRWWSVVVLVFVARARGGRPQPTTTTTNSARWQITRKKNQRVGYGSDLGILTVNNTSHYSFVATRRIMNLRPSNLRPRQLDYRTVRAPLIETLSLGTNERNPCCREVPRGTYTVNTRILVKVFRGARRVIQD